MSTTDPTPEELLAMYGPDVNRGPRLFAAYLATTIVMLFLLGFRYWARLMNRHLGWDDYFMGITWLVYLGLTVLVGFMTSNGSGRHQGYLTTSAVVYVVKLNFIALPFGIWVVVLGKIAVSILIVRALGTAHRWLLWTIYLLNGAMVLLNLGITILEWAQCPANPAALWDPTLALTTSCIDASIETNFSIFATAWNSLVDFALAFAPAPIIWRLQMSTSKRVAIIALLSLGAVSGICSAKKAVTLEALSARVDVTWVMWDSYVWVLVETFIIVFCGCLSTYKPLWDLARGRRRKDGSNSASFAASGYHRKSGVGLGGASGRDLNANNSTDRSDRRGRGKNYMSDESSLFADDDATVVMADLGDGRSTGGMTGSEVTPVPPTSSSGGSGERSGSEERLKPEPQSSDGYNNNYGGYGDGRITVTHSINQAWEPMPGQDGVALSAWTH